MGIFQSKPKTKEELEILERDRERRIKIISADYYSIQTEIENCKKPSEQRDWLRLIVKCKIIMPYCYTYWPCVRDLLMKNYPEYIEEIKCKNSELEYCLMESGFNYPKFEIDPYKTFEYTIAAKCDNCYGNKCPSCETKEETKIKTHIKGLEGLHFRSILDYIEWFN